MWLLISNIYEKIWRWLSRTNSRVSRNQEKTYAINFAIQGIGLIWKQKVWLAICEFLWSLTNQNTWFVTSFCPELTLFCTVFKTNCTTLNSQDGYFFFIYVIEQEINALILDFIFWERFKKKAAQKIFSFDWWIYQSKSETPNEQFHQVKLCTSTLKSKFNVTHLISTVDKLLIKCKIPVIIISKLSLHFAPDLWTDNAQHLERIVTFSS